MDEDMKTKHRNDTAKELPHCPFSSTRDDAYYSNIMLRFKSLLFSILIGGFQVGH